MEVATELSPLSGSDTQCKITERTSYYPQEPNKRPKTRQEKVRSCLQHNALTILTVGGVVGGVILGIILRSTRTQGWTPREIMYINYFGDLFLRMLKSLILPLIISSLVSAIGSLDLSLSGRIGYRAVTYYMVTTVSAVVLGIILVITIQPGVGNNPHVKTKAPPQNVSTVDTLMDLVRNMFPPNLVEACISQHRTEMQKPENSTSATMDDWEPVQKSVSGTNIMGLVVFATVLGITLGKMEDTGKPLLYFFESLSGAMMLITHWVICVATGISKLTNLAVFCLISQLFTAVENLVPVYRMFLLGSHILGLSPVGVLFLVAAKITEMQSLDEVVAQLGMYFLTVMIGLFIHGFIVLPLLYFIITKKNPYVYISNLAQALVTAFGTSSSSATLPVAINCLEERNHVDPRVTRFVLPIGATINMDGTALYEAVAAIFIAQVRQVSLSFGQLVAVSITATAASIGAAGIPQAGLVTMVMVLDTVRLPADDVFLVIAVDWLLDRCRTTVNVVGDSLGAGIVNYLSRNELASLPHSVHSQNGGGDRHTSTSI